MVTAFNVVKGLLNLSIADAFYAEQLNHIAAVPNYGHQPIPEERGTRLVEYSSPNTNKPLHLGHIRNNLLGYTVAIFSASGQKVKRKSSTIVGFTFVSLWWPRGGEGETPGLKGDKLVGNYYVRFDQIQKRNRRLNGRRAK